jgi:hypothetical protein
MNYKQFFLSVLFLSFSFIAFAANIVYPWRATTAIVKSGDSFEIWFNADANQTVNSIQFKSEFLTIAGANQIIINGNWTFDPVSGNKYNQKISVKLPENTPADRYDLILNTSTGNVISYGGVKVVKEFKTEYYVTHISDGHLYQGGYDSDVILQRKSLIVQMSNLMDAEILIETGDNMYNVRNHPEREIEYFLGKSSIGTLGMSKATAATFAVAGDHEGLNGSDFMQGTDQENSDFMNDYWGLQNHSFKYGSARFMMLNNAWGLSATNNKVYQYQVDDAIAWLNGDGAGGNFLLTAGHNYDRMHHFINNVHPLDVCLSGDRHSQGNGNPWEITPGGPRISYTCNDLRGGMKYMIYRVNNTTGTFNLPAGGTGLIEAKASGDVNIPSTWVPRLKQTFSAANNGTVSTNSVTVENKFPFPVLGGKVRFVVPKGSTYAVTNGVVTQEFDGTTVHVVDVNFDVETNSSTTVYIASGTPVDLCPDDPNKLVPGLCGCGVPEGTCVIPVTAITVSPTTAKLNLNVTKQLTASITPTIATNKNISWLSSDVNVATVSSDGFVVAVGGGNATITATSQDGNKVASTNVIVNPSTTVYPAEDAELAGAVVTNNQPGFNGDGFADFTNMSNDNIKWTVYAPYYGDFNLSFRYALMSGPRNLKLTVNGVDKITSIVFPVTGAWSNWSTYNTTQALEAGNNTITLTATGTSGGNFDELVISDGATGVKNLQSNNNGKSFKIFPNPYKQGKLSVQLVGFENQNDIEISISNLLGQTIYKQQLASNLHNEIYLPTKLDQSVYFITVESANLKMVEKLFVR